MHLNPTIPDAFIWVGNINGIYTIKEGYAWLISRKQTDTLVGSWSWIWKIHAPENLKFLIWLLCHDSVPTSSLLYNRRVVKSGICQRCHVDEETFFHCMCDCVLSKCMWRRVGFWSNTFIQQQNPIAWVGEGAEGSKGCRFLAGIWCAWKARNSQCIVMEDYSPHKLLFETLNLASMFEGCYTKELLGSSLERWVTWHPNREHGIILNVDGSCFGNPGRAGFGGVLRNQDGVWIQGFCGYAGIYNNIHVELLAIHHGLLLAWNKVEELYVIHIVFLLFT